MNNENIINSDLREMLERQVKINKQLVEEIKRLRAELAKLHEENARPKKNSTNSSKPPSSDIIKPPRKKPKGKKRKRGGQKGQTRRDCKLTLEQAQEIAPYRPEKKSCGNCGARLKKDDNIAPKITFQYELPEQPVTLTAYLAHGEFCPDCGEIHYGKIPDEVAKAGLLGPRLTAFLATVRAEGNASLSGCQDVLKALGARIARSTICNALERMRRALQAPYDKLLERLPHETHLNIDETTLPQDGKKLWTWTFVARNFTVFKVDPSRSSAVLESVLGADCRAIIGSDLFGAYTKFAKTAPVELQLCWAHLIRDLKLIADSPTKSVANYGERMLAISKKIFAVWHRRSESNAKRTERKLKQLKTEFLSKGTRTQAGGLARTMSKRLKKEGARYFTFVDRPDLEPTNNIAEQQIRQCVLNRRVTQGVRGEKGKRFWENIWTVLATLRRREQNAFDFLSAAASAYFKSEPAPDL